MVDIIGVESIQTIAEQRLSITRDTELLQSFVRVNIKETDISNDDLEQRDDFGIPSQQKKIEGTLSK